MSFSYRLAISIFIIFSVAYLMGHLLGDNQLSHHNDEWYYFHYADRISQNGIGGFKGLLSWYTHDPSARLYPPPSRVGYVLISALLFKIYGTSYFILGFFSAICFVAFLSLNFFYIKKYFDLDTALLACLFLSSSPLMLGMARRVLIESSLNLLWGACVWLLFDFIFEGQIIKFVFFILTFTLSLFFKEGSIVLLPFFILALFIFLPRNKRLFWPLTITMCIVPSIIWVAGAILLLGGWGIFCKTMLFFSYIYKHAGEFNPYVARFCEGPWYRYILDFVILTPLVSLIGFGYSFHYLLTDSKDLKKMYFLVYGVALYFLLNVFQNNQNVRFAMNLEMVMCLFAAFGVQALFKAWGDSRAIFFLVLTALAIFIFNYLNFINIFVLKNLVDPVSYNLFIATHILR